MSNYKLCKIARWVKHYTICKIAHSVKNYTLSTFFHVLCRQFYTRLQTFTQPAVVMVVTNMRCVSDTGGLIYLFMTKMWKSGGFEGWGRHAAVRRWGTNGIPPHLPWLQGHNGCNDHLDELTMLNITFSLSQIYLFEEPSFEGEFVEYTGPAVMPDPKYLFGVSS